jgi:hypothetical protein
MARTTFVNPGTFVNPRKRRKGRKGSRRGKRRGRRSQRYSVSVRRNAGITSFTQNPLILSNPKRKRARRRNPISMGFPSFAQLFHGALSSGGGAAMALAVNTVALNKIEDKWWRRGAQFGAASLGGAFLTGVSPKLGAAYAAAQMYPLMVDLSVEFLSMEPEKVGATKEQAAAAAGATAKDADLEALAADLEDVLDEMSGDDDDLSADDDEYAW